MHGIIVGSRFEFKGIVVNDNEKLYVIPIGQQNLVPEIVELMTQAQYGKYKGTKVYMAGSRGGVTELPDNTIKIKSNLVRIRQGRIGRYCEHFGYEVRACGLNMSLETKRLMDIAEYIKPYNFVVYTHGEGKDTVRMVRAKQGHESIASLPTKVVGGHVDEQVDVKPDVEKVDGGHGEGHGLPAIGIAEVLELVRESNGYIIWDNNEKYSADEQGDADKAFRAIAPAIAFPIIQTHKSRVNANLTFMEPGRLALRNDAPLDDNIYCYRISTKHLFLNGMPHINKITVCVEDGEDKEKLLQKLSRYTELVVGTPMEMDMCTAANHLLFFGRRIGRDLKKPVLIDIKLGSLGLVGELGLSKQKYLDKILGGDVIALYGLVSKFTEANEVKKALTRILKDIKRGLPSTDTVMAAEMYDRLGIKGQVEANAEYLKELGVNIATGAYNSPYEKGGLNGKTKAEGGYIEIEYALDSKFVKEQLENGVNNRLGLSTVEKEEWAFAMTLAMTIANAVARNDSLQPMEVDKAIHEIENVVDKLCDIEKETQALITYVKAAMLTLGNGRVHKESKESWLPEQCRVSGAKRYRLYHNGGPTELTLTLKGTDI